MIFFYSDYVNNTPINLNKVEIELLNSLNILLSKKYINYDHTNGLDLSITKIEDIIVDLKLNEDIELINILIKLSDIYVIDNSNNSFAVYKLISSIKWDIIDNKITSLKLFFNDFIIDNLTLCVTLINNLLVYKNQVTFELKYTEKVYNLLKTLEFYNIVDISVDNVKTILKIDKEFSYLNKFILNKSIKEIEQNTDLSLYYTVGYNKSTKKAETLRFVIHQKSKNLMDKLKLKSNRRDYLKKINLRRIHYLIFNDSIKHIDRLSRFQPIKDYDAERQEIFEELKNNNWVLYENQLEIYDWLDYIKYKRTNQDMAIIYFKYNGKNAAINNDFNLIDLSTMKCISNDIIAIKHIIENITLNDVKLLKTDIKDDSFNISYTKVK